jgi:hypothetical protein
MLIKREVRWLWPVSRRVIERAKLASAPEIHEGKGATSKVTKGLPE